MTHPTLSRKGLAIEVNYCVNTQTDKPLCLPENANSINLFDRFFRSLDTAQSSRMINVSYQKTIQRKGLIILLFPLDYWHQALYVGQIKIM